MIIDLLIDLLFGIVKVALFPFQINIQIPLTLMNVFYDIMGYVGYLLPLKELLPIIIMFMSVMAFRIAVSLIKTIWNLLPIL